MPTLLRTRNGGLLPTLDPFRALEEFDRVFRHNTESWEGGWAGAADVHENDTHLTFRLDMPGVDDKDIQVNVENGTLYVRAERKLAETKDNVLRAERAHGVVTRAFALPPTVDPAKCDASYERGVLTLSFAKREESKPRSIEVKVKS